MISRMVFCFLSNDRRSQWKALRASFPNNSHLMWAPPLFKGSNLSLFSPFEGEVFLIRKFSLDTKITDALVTSLQAPPADPDRGHGKTCAYDAEQYHDGIPDRPVLEQQREVEAMHAIVQPACSAVGGRQAAL